MEKLERFFSRYWLLIILVLSIPAVWALFVPGFFGASDDLHIGWLYEMNQALQLGQIPPRFVPDLSFGFGYPLFDFVFPLPFYLGEIFHSLGFSLIDSIKIVFLLTIPFSAVFMYKFLKEFTGSVMALAGAMIYSYTPYRSNDIYNRGALGEVLPFVFMPILALSYVKIATVEKRSSRIFWVGIGGISLAALILSHDITAYMFFPVALLLAVLLFIFISRKMVIVGSFVFSIGLGLLSSIYFWLPALLESKLVKYDTVFNFVDHFPTLKQLVVPFLGWGASVPGSNDGMSFYIGTINLVVLIIGGLTTIFSWKKFSNIQRVIISWSLATFIIAFLMMNARSAFLWNHTPLIPYFQFPWRFLVLTTFVSPILVVALQKLKIEKIVGLVLIALVLVFNWYFFRPHDFLGRGDSYYINRYIPNPFPSFEYLQTQEEYLRLPLTSERRPTMLYPRVFPQTDSIVSVIAVNALDAQVETSSPSAFVLNYNKYLFPGWSARLDNQEVPIFPGKPFGQVSLNIPPGNHSIDIFYQEPFYKRVLDIISLLTFVGGLWCILQLKLRWKKG